MFAAHDVVDLCRCDLVETCAGVATEDVLFEVEVGGGQACLCLVVEGGTWEWGIGVVPEVGQTVGDAWGDERGDLCALPPDDWIEYGQRRESERWLERTYCEDCEEGCNGG